MPVTRGSMRSDITRGRTAGFVTTVGPLTTNMHNQHPPGYVVHHGDASPQEKPRRGEAASV